MDRWYGLAKRMKVPRHIREALIAEVGGKCANPGCASRRTEAHHIREWAVYATHDRAHMIAICPTCHDAVHHGDLPISDATIYEWKQLSRSEVVRDHVWVEPAATVRLLLGSMAVDSRDPVTVFQLSDHNALGFRIEGADILLVNLRISSLAGEEVVRVEANTLRHPPRSDVTYRRIPGRIEIFVPASEEFIPEWALRQVREQDPFFAIGGRAKCLGLRVIRPGLLRVEGIWAEAGRVIVITDERLAFCLEGNRGPVSMVGEGESSVLLWRGPLTKAMFSEGKSAHSMQGL